MKYGIPLLGDRVAPRSTCASEVLVVDVRQNQVRRGETLALPESGLLALAKVLTECGIDVLVCGGISHEERDFLAARQIDIIDNVVCSVEKLLVALGNGTLRSGFGLGESPHVDLRSAIAAPQKNPEAIDCLGCTNRVCLNGQPCDFVAPLPSPSEVGEDQVRMLTAALDICFEEDRTLCRLSELIYLSLEMRYRRIGVAYCVDLQEPAEILVRVLRRFFMVCPVCCKIGGVEMSEPPLPAGYWGKQNSRAVMCNPIGQAEALNQLGTDLNVVVGLCIGSDCVFTRFSDAPVTTLFVKDKSLANNPIGAVYSDYYLKEALKTARRNVAGSK